MNTDNEMHLRIKKELRFHKVFMALMGVCLLSSIALPICFTVQNGWSWINLIWLFHVSFCSWALREMYRVHQRDATKLRRDQ